MAYGMHYVELKEEMKKEKAETEAFIYSLPVPWRKFAFWKKHEKNQSELQLIVRKFTAILDGYKKAGKEFDTAISERTTKCQVRYVADVDDFDFDEYMEQLGKPDCPGLPSDNLYWHLLNLLGNCLKEKKLLIGKSEELASINGKPPTLALNYWLALPQDVRHVMTCEPPSKIIEVLVEKFHHLKMEQMRNNMTILLL
ncbi:uncharacterized protein LOC133192857 [Saccostrea echinata]|uniref:uncharacterized protein LOC133192857 n=1 Tax=Saccostrea echinata TaxID=191078 RepID=UPI002A800AFE|nr:uncharacterized protein LOC133192857 [Saccostrea echinata]